MKSVSVSVTRGDVKKNISFYRFWTIVFFILILISSFFKGLVFIYHSAGLFLALVYWYFNNRSLGVKGNIISKAVMNEDSFKGSIMLANATFVGWLAMSALLLGMIVMFRPDMFIDTFFFFVFVLWIIHKRVSLFSKSIKKR
jgi:hypothetical protein